MPFLALAVIAAIVFVQEGQRRIPVQYAKRVIGRRMTDGGQTYLPLRVNMAGVIPVIFAASHHGLPADGRPAHQQAAGRSDLAAFFTPNDWPYIVGESIFIILFTYFYTAVTFNPVDQADNLKKYGGFIPGVRPGRPTAEFLDRILARLTFPGRAVPGRRRGAADDPDQPDERELLLRRHLDPDRDRRGARHDEAARGAADDAQLRGLPEVAPCRAGPAASACRVGCLALERAQPHPARPARGRQGHAGRAPAATTSACPTSRPATCCAPPVAEGTELGARPRSTWTPATWCPTT